MVKQLLGQLLHENSEMTNRTGIKLPHGRGVCQKTVGNLSMNFSWVVRERERKKNTDISHSQGNKIAD